MLPWQLRALRTHTTSSQLRETRAVVHALRKKLNTGNGSDNRRNTAEEPPAAVGALRELSAVAACNSQIKSARVSTAPPADFLGLAISKASTIEELFQVVEYHGPVMNKNHLLWCLRYFTKLLGIGHSPEALTATPAFRNFTEIISIRKALFDARECIEIFESMLSLKLEADSPPCVGILETLRLKLRDLTLEELTQFSAVINNVEGKGPHLKMMKLVIPTLFRIRYPDEIDTNNIDQCYSSLIFTLTSRLDRETSKAIVDAALKVAPQFSTRQATTVIHHASDHPSLVQELESLRQIIIHCMESVSDILPKMDEQTVKQIIASCSVHRTASKSFFDVLWKLAPSWSLTEVEHLLSACYEPKTGYMTPEAAEALTQMLLDKRDQSDKVTARGASLFAKTIALCSRYHQPESDGMNRCVQAASVLIEAEACIERLREDPPAFLEFLIALSYFGLFPDPLLQEAFGTGHSEKTAWLLPELERQVIIHHGDDSPDRIRFEKKASLELMPAKHIFEKALKEALGRKQCVYKNIETPLGTRADFVVVMRNKEQPIPIPTITRFFKAIPSATKVIAFLICESGSDTFDLTGMEKLHILIRERQLQAQNLCTVVLHEDSLSALTGSDAALHVVKALQRAYEEGPEYEPKFFMKEVHSVAGI